LQFRISKSIDAPFNARPYDRMKIQVQIFLFLFALVCTASAADTKGADQAVGARIQSVIPDLERYITSGMKAFDVPGMAIGIIANDKLVYGKGFGVRSKAAGGTVDTRTVFQIGSTTKGFLATTLAMMVDRGRLKWDERVIDLYPDFQLKDPWVTREFRVFDLIAQRSGLPPYANDMLGMAAQHHRVERRGGREN